VRRQDGGESTAFAVVADGQVDEGAAGEVALRGPAQLYRFKVRTADGREFSSAIAITIPEAPRVASSPMEGVPGPAAMEVYFHIDDGHGNPLRSRAFHIVSAGKTVTGTTDGEGAVNAKIAAAARAQLIVPDELHPLALTLHVELLRRSP